MWLVARTTLPFLLLTFSACNLGTAPKNLGSQQSESSNKPTDVSDAIALRVAYRDATQDSGTPIRYVVLQGTSGTSTAEKLSTVCKTDASNCECYFYQTTSDTSPVTSSEILYNSTSNFISCKIPTGSTPSDYDYVRLKQVSGSKTTGLTKISETLTLSDIIGSDHTKSKVRSIWTYGCTRNFLQGTGVTTSGVDCGRSSFTLSYVWAAYNYYLYDNTFSPADQIRSGATSQRSTSHDYTGDGGDICGVSPVNEFRCFSTADTLLFGLYAEPTSLFNVRVTLSPGPDKGAMIMGYAAASDGAGSCPVGLTKLGTYKARPASVTSPASLFINANGALNNNLLATVPFSSSSESPSAFLVNQTPGTTACAGGTCTTPAGGTVQLQSVSYDISPPYICGIPASLTQ